MAQFSNDFGQKVTPVSMIDKRRGYFTLPAFQYNGDNWSGVATRVAQYNYSASKAFTLLSVPAQPTLPVNEQFALCIRYREGNVVTRYILWSTPFVSTVNRIPGVPYTGQVIKKNFSLEVWQVQQDTEGDWLYTLLEDTIFRCSILANRSTLQDNSTHDVATASEPVTDFNNIAQAFELPTTGLVAKFLPGDYAIVTIPGPADVTRWYNALDNDQYLENPAPINATGDLNGYEFWEELDNTQYFELPLAMFPTITDKWSIVMLAMNETHNNDNELFGSELFSPSPAVSYVAYRQGSSSGLLHVASGTGGAVLESDEISDVLPLGIWRSLALCQDASGIQGAISGWMNEESMLLTMPAATELPGTLSIAGSSTTPLNVVEVLLYNHAAPDMASIIGYFNSKYSIDLPLPLVYSTEQVGTNNT